MCLGIMFFKNLTSGNTNFPGSAQLFLASLPLAVVTPYFLDSQYELWYGFDTKYFHTSAIKQGLLESQILVLCLSQQMPVHHPWIHKNEGRAHPELTPSSGPPGTQLECWLAMGSMHSPPDWALNMLRLDLHWQNFFFVSVFLDISSDWLLWGKVT